jgi:DNA polymerase-3 subunit alpha
MDSLIYPKDLFRKAKELGQPAIAVTDHGALAAAWDSFKQSKKHGVKLIIGCEFYFVDDLSKENERLRHVILLAKDYEGYKNLLSANRIANDNSIIMFKKVMPRIDWNILEQHSEGLICTTACGGGILARLINTRQDDKALEQAKRLKDIFKDRLAFEIQPHAMKRNSSSYNDYEDQNLVNRKLIKFGDELGVKVIAATNAHYLEKEHWRTHDVLLAIGTGMPVRAVSRLKYPSHEFYVKSREEVVNFFSRLYKDRAEEFCDNTLYFADMCEEPKWIDPKWSNPSGKELPVFPVSDRDDYVEFYNWMLAQPEEIQTINEDVAYLRYWCEKGLREKVSADKYEEYKSRLEEELEVIEYHDFSSYMLIAADYIDYCKKNGVRVGPCRGSVGGCMAAYLVDIHAADPIKYGLVFARFLNKFKTEYPDIDTDFSSAGKEVAQRYITDKYGENYVADVSNINTMTPKVYAKDIARAFEFGGTIKTAAEIGQSIADSIPSDVGTLKSALEKAPLFIEYANSEKYSELRKHAKLLDGIFRNWSTHAGGLVISKRPLASFIPVRRDKNGIIAIEYDKKHAEENGLVKMDVLGVSTLDKIDKTIELIDLVGKRPPINEIIDYDKNDPKTYDMIDLGDTTCIFQLGKSAGAADLCKKIIPRNIEDIALINALVRPNAKGIRKKFVEARNSGVETDLLHPLLKRAFESTHGFAVFEECLMYLAQDVAGWDMHEADRLRKLTKEKGKNPEEVAKWRDDFINDAVNNTGLERVMATKIWDDIIIKFQGYGFNKAHAIGYSLFGYQTAYLKAHFPLEFLTANLMWEAKSNAPVSEKNTARIKSEIRRNNVKILPPDINKSDQSYKIVNSKTLVVGFDALKRIGKNAIPEILDKRPFNSFSKFLSRVSSSRVAAPSIQALAASGSLDSYGLTRKQMFLYGGDYKKKVQLWVKRGHKVEDFSYPWPDDIGEWTTPEKYAQEVYYIGEGLCCNMRQAYPGFFDDMAADFSTLADKYPDTGEARVKYHLDASDGIIEGVIKDYFEFKVKNESSKIFGEIMAKVDIEDPYGNTAAMTLFPSKLEHFNYRLKELARGRVKLEPGIAVYCSGQVNWYDGNLSFIFEDLKRCAPIPSLPPDLKGKQVKMRILSSKKKKKSKTIDKEEILEQVEDELIEDGHSDMV